MRVCSYDRRVLFDAADQVARHRLGQRRPRGPACARASRLREEHRGLSRRVAAADDDDFLAAAQLRLHERRAVVDAGAFELRAGSSSGSFRYSAPVAMITVRAGTRRPVVDLDA